MESFNFEYKGYKFPIFRSEHGRFIVDCFSDSALLFEENAKEICEYVKNLFEDK